MGRKGGERKKEKGKGGEKRGRWGKKGGRNGEKKRPFPDPVFSQQNILQGYVGDPNAM